MSATKPAASTARQTELPVAAPPRADVQTLQSALAFWGLTESPLRRVKKVDEGRWEFAVSVVGMPPILAVGRTRDECLRDALRETLTTLPQHATELRRRAESLTLNADDIETFLKRLQPAT